MRLAGPERELVKKSRMGAWRGRAILQFQIPEFRFLETAGRGIQKGIAVLLRDRRRMRPRRWSELGGARQGRRERGCRTRYPCD